MAARSHRGGISSAKLSMFFFHLLLRVNRWWWMVVAFAAFVGWWAGSIALISLRIFGRGISLFLRHIISFFHARHCTPRSLSTKTLSPAVTLLSLQTRTGDRQAYLFAFLGTHFRLLGRRATRQGLDGQGHSFCGWTGGFGQVGFWRTNRHSSSVVKTYANTPVVPKSCSWLLHILCTRRKRHCIFVFVWRWRRQAFWHACLGMPGMLNHAWQAQNFFSEASHSSSPHN